VVKDKQTVVIGGLMQEREEETLSKMPFFGDIPFIGWLFKYKTADKVKTNLLVFLTPNIVKEAEQMDKISTNKLREFTAREKTYIEDEVFLQFKSGVSREKAQAIIKQQKATIVVEMMNELVYWIKLKQGQNYEDAQKLFAALPDVQKVEPVNRVKFPLKEGK
jgi:general secretion pathway protein D